MKYFSDVPPRTKILAPPLYTVYTVYYQLSLVPPQIFIRGGPYACTVVYCFSSSYKYCITWYVEQVDAINTWTLNTVDSTQQQVSKRETPQATRTRDQLRSSQTMCSIFLVLGVVCTVIVGL